MKRIFLVFTILIIAVAAYEWKFDYQIKEGAARFVENIETDLEKNVVKIYVPAHNNVLESHKIQDFGKGLQIVCFPSLRQCRLREIRQGSPDAGKITEGFVHKWNLGKNSISSDESEVVEERYYPDGEVTDTKDIGDNLRQFYEQFKFPLYREKEIPSDAEIVDITGLEIHHSRAKRSFHILNIDCGDETPTKVYGYTEADGCSYLNFCDIQADGLPVCNDQHITQPMYWKCLKCPWVTSIDTRVASSTDFQCQEI